MLFFSREQQLNNIEMELIRKIFLTRLKVLSLIVLASCNTFDKTEPNSCDNGFKVAEKQYIQFLDVINNSSLNPRNTGENGELVFVSAKDWTSGFFPGVLWYLYEYSGNQLFKEKAEYYTHNIIDQQLNGTTHDMGFKMYCSFGNGYRISQNPEYKKVLMQSAQTLATRFNPNVGSLKSWDHHEDVWQFPVIIDNMMNLELLFWATKERGDSTYYNIAVSHANTTLKNHFRPDYSSYHVVSYDSVTGAVEKKNTHQGYSDESAWARGQAWALYGYTMCYRETGDTNYLNQAINIADYILNNKNLPDDFVPYWDFNAPLIPNEDRDASAAAVICSGLFELNKYTSEKHDEYLAAANKILNSLLSDKYLAKVGSNNNFILMHSVGNKPAKSEVDVPIIYADYYFVEAMLRKHELEK